MKIMIWNAARGGMRSVVVNYRDDGFIDQQGITLIHSYADKGFVGRQLLLIRALISYLFRLLTQKVELVHCHAAMRGSFWRKALFAGLARRFGVPVLLHLHGSEMKGFYESQSPRVRRLIARQLELANAVLVLSDSWKKFILEIAPRSKTIVVPNYVRVPDSLERPARQDVTVLFLGLLGQRKGIYDLLEAFARARRQNPMLKLVVGGNGEIAEAKRLAHKLGVEESVTFLGWIDEAKRREMLTHSDIFVLPSYNEGLPMSVLEAMAYGLPVIATPVGGISELITDGLDGRLVAPGDVAALERELLDLARAPELRHALGEAGHRRVTEHYADTVVLPLLHSIYDETRRPRAFGEESELMAARVGE
jgi:glycosyltransferase involved in cell wall biosynthesis